MKIQIIGRKVKDNRKKVFIKKEDGIYRYSKKIAAFKTNAKINPNNYALIQEGDTATDAISMIQENKDLQFIPVNKSAFKNSLTIPDTEKFMRHYLNVNEALQGKNVLYDASGDLIEGDKLNSYGKIINNNCFVWLNNSFKKGVGFLDLDILTIIGFENEEPIFKSSPLEKCLDKTCWAELESMNNQGFPTKRSRIEKYEPGKTVYFDYPIKDHVARFNANSDRTDLSCYWDPGYSDSSLGVFLCAEGASKKLTHK